MTVLPLKLQFDIQRLQNDVSRLQATCPFHAFENQISLTHRPSAIDPFYDGTGSLYDKVSKSMIAKESDFSKFNSTLRDTYLFKVFEDVQRMANAPLGRVRLIRLAPKACMSMHRDFNYRLILPIVTNEQCFMIFQESMPVHMPADGRIYAVDTLRAHSVMNGDSERERIHLVFSVDSDSPDFLQNLISKTFE